MAALSASDFERFWTKVEMGDGCWNWTGSQTKNGYGLFSVWHRKHSGVLAARLAYEMGHGSPPDGIILHSCDNRRCVRPTHLRTGTPAENTRDMLIRERNVGKKLTVDQVREIRKRCAAGVSQRVIAAEFGVSQGNVSFIARGASWRFVP